MASIAPATSITISVTIDAHKIASLDHREAALYQRLLEGEIAGGRASCGADLLLALQRQAAKPRRRRRNKEEK